MLDNKKQILFVPVTNQREIYLIRLHISDYIYLTSHVFSDNLFNSRKKRKCDIHIKFCQIKTNLMLYLYKNKICEVYLQKFEQNLE